MLVVRLSHGRVLGRPLISRASNILMTTSLMTFLRFKRAVSVFQVVLSLLSLLEIEGRVLRGLSWHEIVDTTLLLLTALVVSRTRV